MELVEKRLQDLYKDETIDMRSDWEALASQILGRDLHARDTTLSRRTYVKMLSIFAGFRSRSQRAAYRKLVDRIVTICAKQQLRLIDLQIDICQKHKYSPSHLKQVLTGRRSMSVEGLNMLAEHLPELSDSPEFQECVATTKRAEAIHYPGNAGTSRATRIPESERRELLEQVTGGDNEKMPASELASFQQEWHPQRRPPKVGTQVGAKVQKGKTLKETKKPALEIESIEEPKLALSIETIKLLWKTDIKVRSERAVLMDALTKDGATLEQILMLIHELLDD